MLRGMVAQWFTSAVAICSEEARWLKCSSAGALVCSGDVETRYFRVVKD
jgi:hypothetical protein